MTTEQKNIKFKYDFAAGQDSSVLSVMTKKQQKFEMPSLEKITWTGDSTSLTEEEQKKKAMKDLLLKRYQPTLEELIQKAVATRMAADFNQLLIDTIIGKKS